MEVMFEFYTPTYRGRMETTSGELDRVVSRKSTDGTITNNATTTTTTTTTAMSV